MYAESCIKILVSNRLKMYIYVVNQLLVVMYSIPFIFYFFIKNSFSIVSFINAIYTKFLQFHTTQ